MTFTLAAVMALGKKERDSAKGMESRPRSALAHFGKMRGYSQHAMARQCRSGCGVGNVGTDGTFTGFRRLSDA